MGSWLVTSTPQCHCSCDCASSPDGEILQLLKTQLDRCGPAHLGPSSGAPVNREAIITFFGLGVFVGLIVGSLLTLATLHTFNMTGNFADGSFSEVPRARLPNLRSLRGRRQLLALADLGGEAME